MKCSFCEEPLACKNCRRPYQPRSGEAHQGVYQPDMQIYCPECQTVLACAACGYVFGEDQDANEPEA